MSSMDTKKGVLALLEGNRDIALSGEEMARRLGLSRAAVWKAIEALRRDGHTIEAAPRRGYRLAEGSDVLSLQGMLPYLAEEGYARKISVFPTLPSTNQTAKERAVAGCEHGTAILADSQSAGRGRRGKSFYSPPGGLYISFVLRPEALAALSEITTVTIASAVLVCGAIEALFGVHPRIKWVNDILLRGKKICGILTEAVSDLESGGVEWVVVGIGINIDTREFPGELAEVAGSVLEAPTGGATRHRLAAEIVNRFLAPGAFADGDTVLKKYEERVIVNQFHKNG